MMEAYHILGSIFYGTPVLTANTSSEPILWDVFLFLFITGGIIAGIVLFVYSKKPEDWKHESKIGGYYFSGELRDLAESIKFLPVDESGNAFIKKRIQTMFFEKITSTQGMSDEEIIDLKAKDKKKLQEIIQDQEIVDWILNIKKKKEKTRSQGFFSKNRISKKERYLMEFNSILDKMEAWE